MSACPDWIRMEMAETQLVADAIFRTHQFGSMDGLDFVGLSDIGGPMSQIGFLGGTVCYVGFVID